VKSDPIRGYEAPDTALPETKWVGRVASVFPSLVWFVFFWPVISGTCQFGFRDTAHFYYPLYRWVVETAAAGESVEWNPLDDLGVAVSGDSSSAMYYPLQALLHCPISSFDYRFGLYVSLHVLLAAYAARFAARVAGCSSVAASAAGIGYAFGGGVLFQTCNVICLAGAAWLPCVFAGVWQMSAAGRGMFPTLLVGTSIALMVLGGDPQAAFLSGLACVPIVLTLRGARPIRRRLTSLAISAVLAVLLSAPQIVSTADRLAESERSGGLDYFSPERIKSSFHEPTPGTHTSAIYEFSFAPWRVIESMWPSITGRFDFVRETVWSSGLPGADRIWTPSIYFGVVLLVAGVWHCRQASGSRIDTQLKWLLGFFLLASFGWYGPVWLINELQLMRGGAGIGDWPGKPTGGLYWLLVNFLPGFSVFRYPSRLLTLVMFAAALLGARGLDALTSPDSQDRENGESKGLHWLAAASAAGMAIAALFAWNPALVERSITLEWLRSFGHTLAVVLAMRIIASVFFRRPGSGKRLSLLMVLVVDLIVANWQLNGFIPRSELPEWTNSSKERPGVPTTVYFGLAVDAGLYSMPARTKLADLHRAEQSVPRTGWHRLVPARMIGAASSIERIAVSCWKDELGRLEANKRMIALASCGVQLAIESVRWKTSPAMKQGEEASIEVVSTSVEALPRARLVNQWEVLPALSSQDREKVAERTREVLRRQVLEGPGHVVIESDELPPPRVRTVAGESAGAVQAIFAGNDRIEVVVGVQGRGLLVIADSLDKNWNVTARDAEGSEKELAVFRANRVMSAVEVQPGTVGVLFCYDPPAAGLWLLIAIGSWGVVAGLSIASAARDWRSGPNRRG
jgi:hypothetical protein